MPPIFPPLTPPRPLSLEEEGASAWGHGTATGLPSPWQRSLMPRLVYSEQNNHHPPIRRAEARAQRSHATCEGSGSTAGPGAKSNCSQAREGLASPCCPFTGGPLVARGCSSMWACRPSAQPSSGPPTWSCTHSPETEARSRGHEQHSGPWQVSGAHLSSGHEEGEAQRGWGHPGGFRLTGHPGRLPGGNHLWTQSRSEPCWAAHPGTGPG